MSAESKLLTSTFLTRKARDLANEARQIAGIEDEPVRTAVRVLYDLGKQCADARAKEIAANSPVPYDPRAGKPTNVGDPLPKGAGGKAKR